MLNLLKVLFTLSNQTLLELLFLFIKFYSSYLTLYLASTKWPYSLSKSCNKCCKIFQVCMTILWLLGHSFLPYRIRGGLLICKIWTKSGVIKKLLRNRGLVEKGGSLRKGGVQNVLSVFLQKSMFSLLLEYFFFFVWKIFMLAVINGPIIINDVYFHFHFIKNFKYS